MSYAFEPREQLLPGHLGRVHAGENGGVEVVYRTDPTTDRLCGRVPTSAGQARDVVLGIRPENVVSETKRRAGGRGCVATHRWSSRSAARCWRIRTETGQVIVEEILAALEATEGDLAKPQVSSHGRLVVRLHAERRVAAGENVDLAIDPSRVHFFSLEAGRRLGD